MSDHDESSNGQFVQELPTLLLKPKQAAQVLALGERTLWQLTEDGEVPAVYVGKAKRYRLADLLEWVNRLPTGKAESTGA